MRNKLLLTTALVAIISATHANAEDLDITGEWNLIQKATFEDNLITSLTGPDKNIFKDTEGNLNIKDAHLYIKSVSAAIDHWGKGNINVGPNAVIEAEGFGDFTYNGHSAYGNPLVHTGDGDINIKEGSVLKLTQSAIFHGGRCKNGYGNNCVNEKPSVNTGKVHITGGDITLDESDIGSDGTGGIIIEGGKIKITDGEINTNGAAITISGGDIELNKEAGIISDGVDEKYNSTGGDFTINGGKIYTGKDYVIDHEVELTLVHSADFNIGGNADIQMTIYKESNEDNHNFGILHEGQKGDINITGGNIALNGVGATIERGGYDHEWVYDKNGKEIISEDEYNSKFGVYPDEEQSIDTVRENLKTDIDDDFGYHVSEGDINISGGKVTLKDGARISTTHKNTGDINIKNNAVLDLDESYIANLNGDINISGGSLNITDSDVEALNNITISGGKITSKTGKQKSVDGIDHADATDFGYGFWAENNFVIGNEDGSESTANIVLDKSYIAAGKDINIYGGKLDLSNFSAIKSQASGGAVAGNLNIFGGDIRVNNGELKAHDGVLKIDGGKVTLENGSEAFGGNLLIGADAEIKVLGGSLLGGDSKIDITGNKNITLDSSTLGADNAITITDSVLGLTDSDIISDYDNVKLDGSIVTISANNPKYKENNPNSYILTGIRSHGLNIENSSELILENASAWVNGDLNIEESTIKATGSKLVYDEEDDTYDHASVIAVTDSIVAKDSNVTLDMVDFITGNGSITFDGGTHSFTNSGVRGDGIIVTGGANITLKGDVDFTSDNENVFRLEGENSVITMNGGGVAIGANQGNNDEKPNNFVMTGGKINVFNGTAHVDGFVKETDMTSNYIQATDATISGGEVNIAEGAYLERLAQGTFKKPMMVSFEKGDINLVENGTINLSGTLISDIKGDNRGLINVNSANAKIDGNVDSVDLTFNSDATLSKLVTGAIGDLSDVTISKGKTLTFDKEMKGTITTVNVENGATLDIGTNTLHSTGDKGVIFGDNSKLKLTITDKNTYGKVLANYVNISNNNTVLDMVFNSAALAKDETATFTIFNESEDKSGVEIDGKFATIKGGRFDIVDNEDGSYTVTNTASASDIVQDAGGSSNNAGTAEAWDNISSVDEGMTYNPVLEKIISVIGDLASKAKDSVEKQKEYLDALTAIAPETAPMVQQTQSETANQVFSAVGTRLSGGSVAGGRRGMSSGDTNMFERVAVWFQGLYNKSKLDETSASKGFDSNTAGTALGIEKQLDNAVKAGIGYAYSKTDIDGFMRSTDVDTHTALLYGEYKPSNWYVNGIATYSWSGYEENKDVAGTMVKAEYDANAIGLQLMTGYDTYFRGYGVTPEIGMRYVHISQDTYTDASGQTVDSDDTDTLTGVVGVKVNKAFELNNGAIVTPEVRLAATYDLVNDDGRSVVTLANGSAYTVDGKALDRFGMEVGLGVTTELNNSIELALGYEGKFRQDYQDNTGLINVKYKF